ncbi:MAG TPA: hypothetical protein ENJ42_00405 [Hellea balneolensis]|uniref:Uncharacterized protein n=1 Tax=Hellea balneolensis TaxID=287478 RepID=A0A7C5LYQ1_9PROT|nr:hypothetical protein [Hellea balneolensis]
MLVSAPWLSGIVDRLRAGSDPEKIMNVYNNASPIVWNSGLVVLWIAAILALISGYQLLTQKSDTDEPPAANTP